MKREIYVHPGAPELRRGVINDLPSEDSKLGKSQAGLASWEKDERKNGLEAVVPITDVVGEISEGSGLLLIPLCQEDCEHAVGGECRFRKRIDQPTPIAVCLHKEVVQGMYDKMIKEVGHGK